MSISVRDILELPALKKSVVVAGVKGLEREVTGTTVAEVPDAAEWLKGGELVLTTGFFFKDDICSQQKWFHSLIEHGSAALAIKPGRFLTTTPDEIKEIAEKNDFPLIELPMDITWPSIIEAVFGRLDYDKSKIIKQSEDIHRKLTEMVLLGVGLNQIADTLARLVDNVVIIENMYQKVLATGLPPAFNREQNGIVLEKRLSGEYRKQLRDSEYCRKVSQFKTGRKFEDIFYEALSGSRKVRQIMLPVLAGRGAYGYITVLETNKNCDEMDIRALEHGATTVALELMKDEIAQETEQALRRNFLIDVLDHREDLLGSYAFHDLDILNSGRIMIVDISDSIEPVQGDSTREKHSDRNYRMNHIVKKVFNNDSSRFFVINEETSYVILFRSDTEGISGNEDRKKADEIGKRLEINFPSSYYYIGIGRPYQNLEELRQSYKDARNAVDIGKRFYENNKVLDYEDLGMYKLFSLIDSKDNLQLFCRDIIGKLIDYDREKNEDLCHVLDVFLNHNGNYAQAARELYIHTNTLIYKVKKAGMILDLDLEKARNRFNIFFALQIEKMLRENSRN